MSESPVTIQTGKMHVSKEVQLQLGGIRIQLSNEDYQAMLAAIGADLAEMHRVAVARERNSLERVKKSHQAAGELRAVLYAQEGDYFVLRDKPDGTALEAFLDKYAGLMGFE